MFVRNHLSKIGVAHATCGVMAQGILLTQLLQCKNNFGTNFIFYVEKTVIFNKVLANTLPNKAIIDFNYQVQFTLPISCPKGLLPVRLKQVLFSQRCLLKAQFGI